MVRKTIVVAALLIAFTSVCLATNSSTTQTLEVGSSYYHFGYTESVGDSEKAWLRGMNFSYKNQDNKSGNFWKASYAGTRGNTNYDGFLQNIITGVTTPYKNITKNTFKNTEIVYGIPVSAEKNQFVYTGYGYRSWDRDSQGPYGYLEKYSWGYIPIGYRYEYKINDKWNGAIDAAAKIMVSGKMSTYSNGGTVIASGNHFTLGNTPGFRIELPFTEKLDSRWSLMIKLWYEYSGIKQSNLVNGYVEPSSTAIQYGIDIGASYQF
jgi:hypothetical protein